MKIENIGQIKGIEQVYVFGQATVKLTVGEILIAKVEQIQGDKVYLRNREGALFMALMQEDLGLAKGDAVEVAASGGDGKYVLHLLDINKEAAGDAARQTIGDKLPVTMAMMKANPGLDPKSAAFLTQNNIPDTPENLAALSDIVRGGSGIGTLLAGILAGLSEADEQQVQTLFRGAQTAPVQSQISDATAPQTVESFAAQSEEVPLPATPPTQGGITVMPGMPDSQSIVNMPQQPTDQPGAAAHLGGNITEAQPSAAAHLGENTPEAQPMPAQMAQPEVRTVPLQTGLNYESIRSFEKGAAAHNEQAAAFGEHGQQVNQTYYNKEQIAEKIRVMFVKPDRQTGAQLKKTIADIPDSLNTLKMMIEHSDNDNKDMFIHKAEQALKQLELMSESKRFDYIQIPLLLKNGAEKTAELYVYRRKRRKEPGDEGTTVLVALDTQNIGRIETLVKAEASDISLEFRLENRDIQQEITKRAKNLAKALEAAGYRLKSVRIKGLETKTSVLNAAAQPECPGIRTGNVDVKI